MTFFELGLLANAVSFFTCAPVLLAVKNSPEHCCEMILHSAFRYERGTSQRTLSRVAGVEAAGLRFFASVPVMGPG